MWSLKWILLAALFHLAVTEYKPVNIAKHKVAYQSSTSKKYTDAHAYRANDGWPPETQEEMEEEMEIDKSNCAITGYETEYKSWWAVDLRLRHRIVDVKIHAGFVKKRSEDFFLTIGAAYNYPHQITPTPPFLEICHKGSMYESIWDKTFSCAHGKVRGRYVVILMEAESTNLNYAYLCQVAVYGYVEDNLALNKPAVQSSIYTSMYAPLAVDGSRNLDVNNGFSCSHTLKEENAWWAVDLLYEHYVETVVITNREEEPKLRDRLGNFVIGVSNEIPTPKENNQLQDLIECNKYERSMLSKESRGFPCNKTARYIIIQLKKKEFLTLCEVEIYGVKNDSDSLHISGVNIALLKPTVQSSRKNTSDDYGASFRAVDGNKATEMTDDGMCTYTTKEKNPWWAIDLHRRYFVRTVTITNSKEYWMSSSSLQFLEIGTSPNAPPAGGPKIEFTTCARLYTRVPEQESHTIQCNNGGRTIVIQLHTWTSNHHLILCEVEVYGYLEKDLALDQNAFQSSTLELLGPQLANDGGEYTDATNKGSCAFTRLETYPWWFVDLQRLYRVQTVEISNIYSQEYAPRLKDFKVGVSSSTLHYFFRKVLYGHVCATGDSIPAGKKRVFDCGFVGRFVFVAMDHKEPEVLTLCDVSVYGYDIINPLKIKEHNDALGKPTYQSTTLRNYNAKLAVDGNSESYSRTCTHTRNELQPWWAVDLLHHYMVKTVQVTARGENSSPERMKSLVVGLSFINHTNDDPPTKENISPCHTKNGHLKLGETRDFKCLTLGRYVVFFLAKNEPEYLSLCEVKVFGLIYTNVAFHKKAYQSSTDNELIVVHGKAADTGAADLAVDGSFIYSCSHTRNEASPWWAVDLKYRFFIQLVNITSRLDCCADKLKNVQIGVIDKTTDIEAFNPAKANIDICGQILNAPKVGKIASVKCQKSGQYVIVLMNQTEHLTLCEVEVFGYLVVICLEDEIMDRCNGHGECTDLRTGDLHSCKCDVGWLEKVEHGCPRRLGFILGHLVSNAIRLPLNELHQSISTGIWKMVEHIRKYKRMRGVEFVVTSEGMYYGCNDDETVEIRFFQSDNMSPILCRAYCQGFIFAGVQNGSFCYCQNEYYLNKLAEGKCDIPCSGDKEIPCGGPTSINMYAVKPDPNVVPCSEADKLPCDEGYCHSVYVKNLLIPFCRCSEGYAGLLCKVQVNENVAGQMVENQPKNINKLTVVGGAIGTIALVGIIAAFVRILYNKKTENKVHAGDSGPNLARTNVPRKSSRTKSIYVVPQTVEQEEKQISEHVEEQVDFEDGAASKLMNCNDPAASKLMNCNDHAASKLMDCNDPAAD